MNKLFSMTNHVVSFGRIYVENIKNISLLLNKVGGIFCVINKIMQDSYLFPKGRRKAMPFRKKKTLLFGLKALMALPLKIRTSLMLP